MEYLTIKAYSDQTFDSLVGTIVVQVNPEKYSISRNVEYNTSGGIGSPNATLEFEKIPPSTLTFELLFDATGVVPDHPNSTQANTTGDLTDTLEQLVDLVCEYQPSIDQSYFLQIVWGTFFYQAKATSLSIDYTLFSASGAPLRARATLNVKEYQSSTAIKNEEGSDTSPASVSVSAGVTLPAISAKVLGDPAHYPSLAAANDIVNFRAPLPAMSLVVPEQGVLLNHE